MGGAMDAHYKGHRIRFTAIPVSGKSAWTFFGIAVGKTGKLEVFTLDREEFADREEATARGLVYVKNWIEESTPESP
jgi:hypothetical protein